MSTANLEQRAYVVIRDKCPMRIAIEKDDFVEIACGGSRDENFEFILEAGALRTLVELGGDALARMTKASANTEA